jgi:catechol 2,3-dioxygenase-like lactoylglutathione lyase family enzyme
MPADVSPAVRFHISLNVSDLGKSVQFFQALFGKVPAKQRSDYAKFELDDPPLVLSLEPHAPAGRGALNHAGFRFPDSAKLVEAQSRLEWAGIHTQREEGVECCYARQTKFWAHDPDGGLWEFYVLEGDIDHRGAGQALDAIPLSTPGAAAPRSWEHRLGQPLLVPAEFADESLDEARLRGSFNVPAGADEVVRFLKDVRAALRPDGNMLLHILTAESPLSSAPQLPGGAGSVKFVPVRGDLLNALEAAGFVDMQLTTFRSRACFEHEGIPLRETRITCRRPTNANGEMCTIVFKGPFAEATDDEGHTWHRGRKTTIPASRWEALQRTPLADLFVELPVESVVGACST